MIRPINNEKEYNDIVLILKGDGDQIDLLKEEKRRLKKVSKFHSNWQFFIPAGSRSR
jgi:hypothetical protein